MLPVCTAAFGKSSSAIRGEVVAAVIFLDDSGCKKPVQWLLEGVLELSAEVRPWQPDRLGQRIGAAAG